MVVSYFVFKYVAILFFFLKKSIIIKPLNVILNEVIYVPGAYPVTGFPAGTGGGAGAEAEGSHSGDVDVV